MRLRPHFIAVALVLAVAFPPATAAQDPGMSTASVDVEVLRTMLISGFERQKANDVTFARAIPDSALRWAPNDIVRDFAQQVMHASNNLFLARFVSEGPMPSFGDTAVVLNDKDALADAVTQAYDWLLDGVRNMPADQFMAEVTFIGGQELPKWRVYLFALEHATWTRGQLVPYFRAHGMTPPQVQLF